VTGDDAATWARALLASRAARTTRDPITVTTPLTIDDAYAIQRHVTARRIESGERIIGWKLGYTSVAMRRQMGVDAPNHGPLTDAMVLASGAQVSERLVQPRVEPEIGVRMAGPVPADAGADEVQHVLDDAFACLEVVDSVFTDYRFRLEDNTADGSSAAQVVVGSSLGTVVGLDEIDVVLRRNGEEVGRATGAAASGHPLAGVAWLAGQLAARGSRLEAGQIVITGGLTAAVPLAPGDEVVAVFGGRVTVSVLGPARSGTLT
jgi:2-keto-4-pentenoate hydratase